MKTMDALNAEQFRLWMETYGRASAADNPQASADLFAPDALYYKGPFDEPINGREAIYEYWKKGAQRLKDKESSFEILSVQDHLGIARWQSRFTVVESGKRLSLDCLFVVEFDEAGLCQSFREWWHVREC